MPRSPLAFLLAALLVATPRLAGGGTHPSPHALSRGLAGSPSAAQVTVSCGDFVDIAASLTPVSLGSVAWGDYDTDGDLDVLLTGQASTGPVAKVYRNDGGAFIDIGAPLTGVYFSSAAWGDHDNDGDLDILLTGSDGSAEVSKVYRNDGGSFSDIGASLTAVNSSSVAWGDHDNDGDLDILLTGFNNGYTPLAKVHRNDGGAFASIAASLPGVAESSTAWGDYDNDGDLDILLAGVAPIDGDTKLYRNDGGGVFTDIGALLTGVENCSLSWGDYDNDGDLDILLTGVSFAGGVAKVYRNDGGAFTDIAALLTAVEYSSAAWGDYDNDGDLDILLTGSSVGGRVTKIYRNDGGAFIDIGASLIAVDFSSVAWGDYDNDGDLDILLTGSSASGRVAKVYRNDACLANSPPTAPGALNTSVTAGGTTFSWSASTDAQTPASGLHYNLRVGTTPGGNQISSAMASSSGTRRVARLGNAQQSGWKLKLPPGNYYWSVQAIDPAFAGSPFAAVQMLTVGPVDVPNAAHVPAAFALLASQPNPFSRSAAIGFHLPRSTHVALRIYDLGGRVVRTLTDGSWPAGRHRIEWDGTDGDGRPAAAGVYFYAIEADEFRSQHRMVRMH
jgi:predicted nucleotidyltransferase